ncbi:hypothetical protein JCM8097_005884 [Rhodosporidiobolus ruineniae]
MLALPHLDLRVTNLYAPANDAKRAVFFANLSLPLHQDSPYLVGGDLNDCPDPAVDRQQQSRSRGHHWSSFLSALPSPSIDALQHRKRTSVFFTRPHKNSQRGGVVSWSRIDHILLSTSLEHALVDSQVFCDAPYSDHRPVLARFTFDREPEQPAALPSTSSSTSRISPLLFSDLSFSAELSAWYNDVLSPRLAPLPPLKRWEEAKKELTSFSSRAARLRAISQARQRRAAEQTLATLEAQGHLSPQEQAAWTAASADLLTSDLERRRSLALRAHLPLVGGAPAEADALHRRVQARRAASTFTSLRLSDGSSTTDISAALSAVDQHYQGIFSLSPHPPHLVAEAQASLLQHIRLPPSDPDPHLSRRWQPDEVSFLSSPFTREEVLSAIKRSPSSSSPGPSGLPYEFFKQNSSLLVDELVSAFNAIWDAGQLTPTLATAHVRLLNKNKPGADPSSLKSYRPIALRDCDYRLLARVLVARVGKIIAKIIPLSQGGFIPGRSSADLGRHLQLLLEELQAGDFPYSVLLSLDQEQAYDKVSHDWIILCFRAYGAPDRFLRLLAAMYAQEHLRARYIINGFLSDGVSLRTGLPQGDPFSCFAWILSFQPFLDNLLIRRIALSLPSPLSSLRANILTYVAFADDTNLAIQSLTYAIPRLENLAVDWKAASNGRLNTNKTVALAVGESAKEDSLAPGVVWIGDEGYGTWAGFPLSPSGPPLAFYASLLQLIQRRLNSASGSYASLRARALYANSHVLSLSLHLLSFAPAPSSFLDDLERALLGFIWGRTKQHAVRKAVVFSPVERGGLGALSPHAFDTANTLRFYYSLLTDTSYIWSDLALSSFRRNLAPPPATTLSPSSFATSPTSRTPLSLLRYDNLSHKHPLWSAVVAVACKYKPVVNLSLLSAPHLLDFPPSLFSDSPSLKPINTIASLHNQLAPLPQAPPGLYTLPPPSPPYPKSAGGLRRAQHDWLSLLVVSPAFSRFISVFISSLPLPLPPPLPPPPAALSFLSLPPDFSTSAARRALSSSDPEPLNTHLEPLLHPPPSAAAVKRIWSWIRLSPATPREADQHWRILHGALTTRRRQYRMQQAPDDSCVHCGASDTLVHALALCPFSAAFWTAYTSSLASSLSDAFSSTTMSPREVLLGLPTLSELAPSSATPVLRAAVAVGLSSLLDARWARIRPTDPTSASPLAKELAARALSTLSHRMG